MITFESLSVKPDEIIIENRVREDLGDLDSLAMSIHKLGLLHPPVYIKLPDGKFKLVAGERRTRCCFDRLGWTEMPVRIPKEKDGVALTPENISTLVSEDDLLEMELVENCKRKDWSYSEQVKAVKDFHEIMQRKYGEGRQGRKAGWGMRDTAQYLGISLGLVSQDIKLARAMENNPKLAEEKNKGLALTKLKRDEEKKQQDKIVETAERIGYTPDCIKLGDNLPLLKGIESETVDLVFMDPPYAINYDDNELNNARWDGVYNVKDIPHEIFQQLSLVLRECFRVMKKDSYVFCWYHMDHHETVKVLLKDAGFEVCNVPFFWVKDKHGGGTSPYIYSNAVEPCLYAWKGKPKMEKVGVKNYLMVPGVPGSQRIHPTEKPLRLIMPILDMACPKGGLVLDPYAGSGSTLRAAIATGRQALGFEMKEEHYKAAVAQILKQIISGERKEHVRSDGESSAIESNEGFE